jgi:pimeloyl-ACP methyl ester carboxylesterase
MYSFPHDDVTVTVHPAQQDRHTVVLINGVFGGGWTWEPVVTALTARGYGAVVTAEPLAAHATSEEIPALLQSISLLVDTLPDPAPVLCGNSLGGLVAMELAAADPSRWSGVILTGAPGLGDEQDPASFGSALRTPSLKLGYVLADRLIHKKELITPELVDRCTQALTPRIMLRAGRALRATKGYDARPLFDRIDCPVLLLCGARDEVSPLEKWRDAATSFPDAEFVEIPDAGHSPMLEEPDVFTSALLDWLDTLPAPTAAGQVLGAR